MDALSTILKAVHLKGMAYEKVALSAPWGLDVRQDANSQFWRVEKGTCFLKVPGAPVVQLKEGDLVFVPHGSSHWLADAPGSKRVPSAQYVAARLTGQPLFTGGGVQTILIGGHFEFHTQSVHPFLRDLPAIMHLSHRPQAENATLRQYSRMLYEELSAERPGSALIISHLAEIIFIGIIRAYLEQTADAPGFLQALKDERISKALQLMHQSPATEWTIDSLARAVGASRTLFFNQFKKLTGDTPIGYLAGWRMIRAKEILAVSKENISEIAQQVGYQSEAAFNRAFKQKTGQTPAHYRRGKVSS